MRVLLFLPFILLLTSGLAEAGDTAFSIEPGDTQTFIVTGNYPSVTIHQGNADVGQPLLIGVGIWRIEIACLSSSPVTCEGTIHS